jgi:hypothetical protein
MKGFIAAALAVLPYAVERKLRRPLHLALAVRLASCTAPGGVIQDEPAAAPWNRPPYPA